MKIANHIEAITSRIPTLKKCIFDSVAQIYQTYPMKYTIPLTTLAVVLLFAQAQQWIQEQRTRASIARSLVALQNGVRMNEVKAGRTTPVRSTNALDPDAREKSRLKLYSNSGANESSRPDAFLMEAFKKCYGWNAPFSPDAGHAMIQSAAEKGYPAARYAAQVLAATTNPDVPQIKRLSSRQMKTLDQEIQKEIDVNRDSLCMFLRAQALEVGLITDKKVKAETLMESSAMLGFAPAASHLASYYERQASDQNPHAVEAAARWHRACFDHKLYGADYAYVQFVLTRKVESHREHARSVLNRLAGRLHPEATVLYASILVHGADRDEKISEKDRATRDQALNTLARLHNPSPEAIVLMSGIRQINQAEDQRIQEQRERELAASRIAQQERLAGAQAQAQRERELAATREQNDPLRVFRNQPDPMAAYRNSSQHDAGEAARRADQRFRNQLIGQGVYSY